MGAGVVVGEGGGQVVVIVSVTVFVIIAGVGLMVTVEVKNLVDVTILVIGFSVGGVTIELLMLVREVDLVLGVIWI